MNTLLERPNTQERPEPPPPLREGPARKEFEDYVTALVASLPDDKVLDGDYWAAVRCEIPRPVLPPPVPHADPVWRHLFLLSRWAKMRRMAVALLGDTRDARYHSGETRRLLREILGRVDALKDEWARAAWRDTEVTATEEAAIAALHAMDADGMAARAAEFHGMPMGDLVRELTGCR